MRKYILLLASVTILLFATSAKALIEPSLPPPTYPVAGEAELTYNEYKLYVDWIVDAIEDGYLYLYQVENALGIDVVDEFYIQPIIAGPILEYGWAEDLLGYTIDLDSELLDELGYNHHVDYFSNLLGENEPTDEDIESVEGAQLAFGIGGWKLEWSFNMGNGIPPGDESDALYLFASVPPQYYPGHANDTVTFDGKVPAPTPEPTSLLLFGMGVLGLFGLRKKKS